MAALRAVEKQDDAHRRSREGDAQAAPVQRVAAAALNDVVSRVGGLEDRQAELGELQEQLAELVMVVESLAAQHTSMQAQLSREERERKGVVAELREAMVTRHRELIEKVVPDALRLEESKVSCRALRKRNSRKTQSTNI